MAEILIVEDDEAISHLIQLNLTLKGHKCVCCFDGLKAVNLVEAHVFDLVLLDLMLPKLDGLEVLNYVRTQNIPVMIVSAKDQI